MKNIFSGLFGLGLLLCLVTISYSGNTAYIQDDAKTAASSGSEATAGQLVVVGAANTKSANDLEFQPSTQVVITGMSSATGFAHGGYHYQVMAKDNGKAFAMASDAANVFFLDIAADGTDFGDVSLQNVTNKSGLTGWATM